MKIVFRLLDDDGRFVFDDQQVKLEPTDDAVKNKEICRVAGLIIGHYVFTNLPEKYPNDLEESFDKLIGEMR